MKRSLFIFFLILISASNSYAGISVCEGANGRIYNKSLRGDSINGCFYYDPGYNTTSEQYEAIKTLLQNVDMKYLKMDKGIPAEMTQEEKDQVDQDLETIQNMQTSNAIDGGQITTNELLKAMVAVVSESKSTTDITEQAVIDKIKEQKGVL